VVIGFEAVAIISRHASAHRPPASSARVRHHRVHHLLLHALHCTVFFG
jgi:hypothetical protein